MVRHRRLISTFALAAVFTVGGLTGFAHAAEFRGIVSKVEAGGQVQIDLPAGAVARPGDQVRIEAVIPGVGPVEIKARWRVKLVGEGFVIAEPEGRDGGMPQVGHTAIVTSATAAPAAPAATAAPAERRPADAEAISPLSAAQLAMLEQRANGGDAQAMVLLGVYHSGSGGPAESVPRKLDEAIRWYERAAASGDAGAMTSLGFLHKSQRKDHASAARWFRQAAEKGNKAAMSALSRLYAQGSGVPKNDALAFEWAKKAAADGNEWAAYELADMYFKGRGTRQEFVEAAHWYRRAADKGFLPAMTQLAQLYTNGMGVAKDQKRGFEWALKAAEAGSSTGMYQVGTYYLQGNGTAAKPAEARRWYEQAANAGDAEAMYGLSFIYANGRGVATNAGLAADWMVRAISAGSFQAAESVMRKPSSWSKGFRQALQKRLSEAGVYKGKTDGNIDATTRRSIVALSGRELAR
jgi:uncharacterized protein